MTRRLVPVGFGFVAGVAMAAVDHFAFEGEVSPIVIVAMLLVATTTAGFVWGRRAWAATAAAWVFVPAAHLIKHLLGLPDALHPNTYASILKLAAFTIVVAGIGAGCGNLLRKLKAAASDDGPKLA